MFRDAVGFSASNSLRLSKDDVHSRSQEGTLEVHPGAGGTLPEYGADASGKMVGTAMMRRLYVFLARRMRLT